MSRLLDIHIPPNRLPLFYFAAGVTSAAILSTLYTSLIPSKPKHIPSPLQTQHTSPLQINSYPSANYIPGARDIVTPHGSVRVYEFGPEDGRKVVLIHGISTPSPALAPIAEKLAAKGCRVLFYDLFGRGFSDAPGNVTYDERLYITQLFYVLASSPLSWAKFSVMGYSMGGGIAAAFASYFPGMVEDLVLLAPAGLIRPESTPLTTRLIYSGVFPQSLVEYLVARRLKAAPNVKTTSGAAADEDPVNAETAGVRTAAPEAFGRVVDAAAIVNWQMEKHVGFLGAFVDSFQKGPIRGQHEQWRLIGRRLDAQRSSDQKKDEVEQGLRIGKVLMVVGLTDDAIHTPELLIDAFATLGEQNLEVLQLDAGHEVPVTRSAEIVDWIWRNWAEKE